MIEPAYPFVPDVGLCSVCRSGQPQPNGRGSRFWRCLRAETEAGYLKYPPLPVRTCSGFEARPDRAPPSAAPS